MANAGAKGDLALTIDELGLEAVLRFTPDANGAEWTADKVMRLVMDQRVGGVTQKRAEDLVGKFARARGATTEVLAKGTAPEEPVPEEVEWEELAPPDGLEAIVAATIASAPEPELYKIRIETTTTEKTVKKPGALPFLPPKIEKVQVQEKREVRERIYPDIEVLKSGFARRGQRLGLMSPSKPGKAGKSIFGKPIPPQGRDSAFTLGAGILRNKNELVADLDGVLRAGSRWAELIAVALPSWSVARSSDGSTWLLDFHPGDPRLPAPGAAEMLKAAVDQGADATTLLGAAELEAILREAAQQGAALFSKSISRDRDGGAEVVVSPDGIRAALNVRKSRGAGRPLDLAMVTQALKASGVRAANPEQLKKDVIAFYKGSEGELLDYVVAEGKAPTRGKDRTVSLNLSFMPEARAQETRERLLAHPGLPIAAPSVIDDPVDAEARLAQVQAGQRFGELSAQVPGQNGVDLAGKVIPGIPGNDPPIRIHENVTFQKGVLAASISGLLVVQERAGAWSFRVIPFRDSVVEVLLSSDSMEAFLSIQAEQGLGAPLTVENSLKALAEKGVVHGLDPRAVAEAVAQARAGQVVLRRLVASGTPPRPAGSGRRVWLVGDAVPSEGPRPMSSAPIRVAMGAPVLRVEGASATPVNGRDVLGRDVPAPSAGQPSAAGGAGAASPGAAASFEHDATVVEEALPASADAPQAVLFRAAVAGELRVEAHRLSIIDRLVVRGDVTETTGNLRFAGPVQIAGAVRRGLQVFAGGDAQISGAVEASLVSSDGAIRIGGGIKGERRGTLRAKRGIEVGFAEQALILAVEDIKVRGSCALCSVKTNGRLHVGADQPATAGAAIGAASAQAAAAGGAGSTASLVGGITRARKGVEAANLGSANGIKTEISFGQDYLMADMIEAEEREIEKLKLLIVKQDRAMAEAEKARSGLDQARQDKVKLVKLLEKRSIRLFDLREKFEEHFAGSEVVVRGTVYPGVILESHNRFFEVRSRKTNVAFSFDPEHGRIVERRL